MEKREILLEIIQHYTNGNKRQFAKMLGTIPQNVSSWIKRNSFDADLISAKCRDVNPAFLLTGEGPVALNQPSEESSLAPATDLTSLDRRINELLTICSNLSELIVRGQETLAKSQQQFDRVLTLYEKLQDVDRHIGMVAEDSE